MYFVYKNTIFYLKNTIATKKSFCVGKNWNVSNSEKNLNQILVFLHFPELLIRVILLLEINK